MPQVFGSSCSTPINTVIGLATKVQFRMLSREWEYIRTVYGSLLFSAYICMYIWSFRQLYLSHPTLVKVNLRLIIEARHSPSRGATVCVCHRWDPPEGCGQSKWHFQMFSLGLLCRTNAPLATRYLSAGCSQARNLQNLGIIPAQSSPPQSNPDLFSHGDTGSAPVRTILWLKDVSMSFLRLAVGLHGSHP